MVVYSYLFTNYNFAPEVCNNMKRYSLFIILALLFNYNFSYALSNNEHEKFMKRDDYRISDSMLNKTWKSMKNISPKWLFNIVLESQREWVKDKRDLEAESLNTIYPYTDDCTRYFLVTLARAVYVDYITKFIKANYPLDKNEFLRFFNSLNEQDFIDEIVDNIDIAKTNPYNRNSDSEVELKKFESKIGISEDKQASVEAILNEVRDNLESVKK